YRGRLVETGTSEQVFRGPNHPYTKQLLAASSDELAAVSVQAETAAEITSNSGCAFAGRCPLAQPRCREVEPAAADVGEGHLIACWRHAELS
ncbi:MAG: ABC transporter ATP-binding protein, partial [Mesorhizobium sp.]